MDNDILRVNNKDRIFDEDVNVSSFGESVQKKVAVKKENSVHNFLEDELLEKQVNVVIQKAPVDKPKLFEPIALSVLLIMIALILSIVCYFSGELFIVPAYILILGLTVPISFSFFFFRLNTRGDVNFLTIVKLFLVGIAISIVLSLIFELISRSYFGDSIIFSVVKCTVELFVVTVITIITLNSHKNCSYIAVLLVACAVSSGFACAHTVTECFYDLFMRTEVTDGNVTQSLGAIINDSKFIKFSVRALVLDGFNIGLFKPFMFISLTIINGYAFKYISTKTNNRTTNSMAGSLFFPLTICLYSLSEFISSIPFLQLLYNAIALVVAIYSFIKIINFCIKNENYK